MAVTQKKKKSFVTMYVGGQLFGLPISQVRDILVPGKIFSVPLAMKEVSGSVNLRGRIVTVINVSTRLSLKNKTKKRNGKLLCVTVLHKNELYGLLVDRIGDVMELSMSQYEASPSTLDSHWREFCDGVYRLDKEILVVLNVERFMENWRRKDRKGDGDEVQTTA